MTVPKRDAIADELRKLITDGTYAPGDKLPTEAELILSHQVARGTVRDALQILEDAGLVERRVGTSGGTFVRRQVSIDIFSWRDDQPMSSNSEADLFARTVREQGHTPTQDFSAHEGEMPAEFAELLGVDPDSPAIVRRCVRYIDRIPHSVQTSWYPGWLVERVPLLRSPNDIPQGTTRLLADEGFVQVAAYGYTVAHRLGHEDAETLRMTPGQPVLTNVLVGFTEERPLRVSAALFAPGTRLMSAHGDVSVIERFRR